MSEKKFETSYKKLEKVVERLGSEGLDLEDALKLYEEGIKLSRFCSKKLEEAEKKIKKLSRDSKGKLITENLDLFDEETAQGNNKA